MMVAKSSIAVAQKVERELQSTRKERSIARSITLFNSYERKLLFAHARTALRAPGIEIRTMPAQKEIGRMQIVVPRKVGTSPERNLIKRQLKALFYENKWYAHAKDVLIFIHHGAAEHLTFEKLHDYLQKALEHGS